MKRLTLWAVYQGPKLLGTQTASDEFRARYAVAKRTGENRNSLTARPYSDPGPLEPQYTDMQH